MAARRARPARLGRFVCAAAGRPGLGGRPVAAAVAFYLAWVGYDEPGRPDGTVGHIYIDFSGQWIMGRMFVRGEGPYLYDRERVGTGAPAGLRPARDGETAFGWLIEAPDRPGVGGPLYPPIQALFFYPLGLLPPLTAYRIAQVGQSFVDFCHRLSRLDADARPRLAGGGRRSGDGVSGLQRRHLRWARTRCSAWRCWCWAGC